MYSHDFNGSKKIIDIHHNQHIVLGQMTLGNYLSMCLWHFTHLY